MRDVVAVAMEEGREAVFLIAVGLGRDVWHGPAVLDLAAEGVAVIALVAMQNIAGRHAHQKLRASRAIYATWPPVGMRAAGRHWASVSASIFVVRPPLDRSIALARSLLCRHLQSDAPLSPTGSVELAPSILRIRAAALPKCGKRALAASAAPRDADGLRLPW